MRYRTSKKELAVRGPEALRPEWEDRLLHLEVDSDILRMRIQRREAEEIVEAQGLRPDDDLYEFYVEEEMDRMWDEAWEERHGWEQRRWEREMEDEMRREELLKGHAKSK